MSASSRCLFVCVVVCFMFINMITASEKYSRAKRSTVGEILDRDYWFDIADATLAKRLKWYDEDRVEKVAKNIIFFLGDGMGIPSVTAGRIMKGQLNGMSGEDESLIFDDFPYVSLAKTYSTNGQVSDSSSTASALFCGSKTKNATTCVDDHVELKNCSSQLGREGKSIIKHAIDAGMAAGIVTSASVTHATPSTLYASAAYRYWECDADLSDDAVEFGCPDIASQLLINGSEIQVVMGGGRKKFLPNDVADPEYDDTYGDREDGRDLTEEWLEMKSGYPAHYIWNKTDLADIDPEENPHVLGLFEHYHLNYVIDNDKLNDTEQDPALADMVSKAIDILDNNDDGFILVVEGAKIDIAHHHNWAAASLREMVTFDLAIETALNMTDQEETLIIVTADHSHAFAMTGWPERGNPILGLATNSTSDYLPYTTLAYLTGPNWIGDHLESDGTREDLTDVDTEADDYLQYSLIPTHYGTHNGEDVAVFAIGPRAYLLSGVYEQNYVNNVMKFAACLGEYDGDCDGKRNSGMTCAPTSLTAALAATVAVFIVGWARH